MLNLILVSQIYSLVSTGCNSRKPQTMMRWRGVWAGLSAQSACDGKNFLCFMLGFCRSGDFKSVCIMTPRCMKKRATVVLCVKDNRAWLALLSGEKMFSTMSPISELPWQEINTTYIPFCKGLTQQTLTQQSCTTYIPFCKGDVGYAECGSHLLPE